MQRSSFITTHFHWGGHNNIVLSWPIYIVCTVRHYYCAVLSTKKSSREKLINPRVVFTITRQRSSSTIFIYYLTLFCEYEHQIYIQIYIFTLLFLFLPEFSIPKTKYALKVSLLTWHQQQFCWWPGAGIGPETCQSITIPHYRQQWFWLFWHNGA